MSGSCICSCSYFTPAPSLLPPQFEDLGFELTKENLIEIVDPAEISIFNVRNLDDLRSEVSGGTLGQSALIRI